MKIETLVLFFAVSLVSTATPGPAVLYVTSHGVSGGMRAAVPSSLGVLAADVFYIFLSITGLTAVLLASYELFTVVRWVGAVYLIYLGSRLLWAGLVSSPTASTSAAAATTPTKALIGGFVLHAANPKALLYFGSLVPQFVDPSRPLGFQLASLAFVHLGTASLVMLSYSVLSARFRRFTAGTPARRAFNIAAGSLLVAAGASLAFVRRSGD